MYKVDYKKKILPFSKNSTDVSERLERLTQDDKTKVTLLLEDLTELNNALDKEWREKRIHYLYEKDQNEIKKINQLAREKKIPADYFAPRISNVWALDTHSKVWQYNFVNHFLLKHNIVSTIYLDQFESWLSRSYPLAGFVKRLGNLNYYSVDKEDKLYKLLEEIKEVRIKNSPHLPNYKTIAQSYLDELKRKELVTQRLAKYTLTDIL